MTPNERAEPNSQPSPDIDRLVHEPARLSILALLHVVESADFLFLLKQTGLTKGNLSSHLGRLEDARYIEVRKEFVDKIPRTLLRITSKGSKALATYRRNMMDILQNLPE